MLDLGRQFSLVESYPDGYVLSGVLKKIFDKMPVPVVPFSMYKTLMEGIKSTIMLNLNQRSIRCSRCRSFV